MPSSPSPTQTFVKHQILRNYLEKWRYIIVNGLKGSLYQDMRDSVTRFVYVDCFANNGEYLYEKQVVPGSALIGIRALDELRNHWESNFKTYSIVDTTVWLIEKDPREFASLRSNLEKHGYANRLKICDVVHALPKNSIGLINGDWVDHRDDLLKFTKRSYTWSLYFIDPYGYQHIPFSAVAPIVESKRHDTIINYMYSAINRASGSAGTDTPHPKHIKHVHYGEELFGPYKSEWHTIAEEFKNNKLSSEEKREEWHFSIKRHWSRLLQS